MKIRQILAPTDFSEGSRQAVAWAYDLARRFGAKLVLLHVIEALPSYIGFLPAGDAASLLEDLRREAAVDLAKMLPKATSSTVEVTCQVVGGLPHSEIVKVAAAKKVDLIVIATHGRTGLSHLFMGSVTERVVRTAPCPVLTLKPVTVAPASVLMPVLNVAHSMAG